MSDSAGSDLHLALLPFAWILTGLSLPIVVARVVTKCVKLQKLIWEDYLMIVSMVIPFSGCSALVVCC